MAEVAWIIGGGSGIGAAVARRLAAKGWTVAISGRRADRLAALAAASPSIHAFPLDVTDGPAVAETVMRIAGEFGRIDLAVFGAVAQVRTPPGQYEAEGFHRAFDVNYLGFVRSIDPLVAQMTRQGGGQIAAIASLAGYFGLPGASAYSSSKAALISLCETMHTELAPRHIAVRLVSPGFVRTEFTARNRFPMPLLMNADEAGRRIVDGLLRSHRFEIAFPRRMVLMTRAIRLLPYPAFFALMRRLLPKG